MTRVPHLAAPALALCVHLASLPAFAQADPTRPHPDWAAAQNPGGVVAAPPGPPRVSVVVTGRARSFVMVDGMAVHVGETYGGSMLAAIGPDGPVWQKGGPRDTMGAAATRSAGASQARGARKAENKK